MEKRNLKYTFKYIYKNGQSKVSRAKASTPENLRYDFDEQLDWNEYDKFVDSFRTTKEILDIAKKVNKNKEQLCRIEIINIDTNEVIDFIELK